MIKKLIKGFFKSQGYNNFGKKVCRYKGRGHKQKYRLINFFYNIWNITGILKSIEYDPIRNSYISLILYQNGIFCYNILLNFLKIGYFIRLGNFVYLNIGNSLFLSKIALSIKICNITLYLNDVYKIIRSAGTFGYILKKEFLIKIILRSHKIRFFLSKNIATIGRISNINYFLKNLYKAGKSIWLNKKPKVRGIAMNPVDHPNGGNTPGKKYRSLWGTFYKHKKTKNKKYNLYFI